MHQTAMRARHRGRRIVGARDDAGPRGRTAGQRHGLLVADVPRTGWSTGRSCSVPGSSPFHGASCLTWSIKKPFIFSLQDACKTSPTPWLRAGDEHPPSRIDSGNWSTGARPSGLTPTSPAGPEQLPSLGPPQARPPHCRLSSSPAKSVRINQAQRSSLPSRVCRGPHRRPRFLPGHRSALQSVPVL